jgi:hypothetical protein
MLQEMMQLGMSIKSSPGAQGNLKPVSVAFFA